MAQNAPAFVELRDNERRRQKKWWTRDSFLRSRNHDHYETLMVEFCRNSPRYVSRTASCRLSNDNEEKHIAQTYD